MGVKKVSSCGCFFPGFLHRFDLRILWVFSFSPLDWQCRLFLEKLGTVYNFRVSVFFDPLGQVTASGVFGGPYRRAGDSGDARAQNKASTRVARFGPIRRREYSFLRGGSATADGRGGRPGRLSRTRHPRLDLSDRPRHPRSAAGPRKWGDCLIVLSLSRTKNTRPASGPRPPAPQGGDRSGYACAIPALISRRRMVFRID